MYEKGKLWERRKVQERKKGEVVGKGGICRRNRGWRIIGGKVVKV